MAILTAYYDFNSYDDLHTFTGTYISTTSTLINLYNPDNTQRVEYRGTFKYNYGYLSSGTVKSATVYDNGIKHFMVTGSYDAPTLSHYTHQKDSVFLNYVFSGNDTFNGSSGDDWFTSIGGGNDVINGNGGNDYIDTNMDCTCKVNGGTGKDYIASLGNKDSLTGGKQADLFNVYDQCQTIITDFSIKDGDKLMYSDRLNSDFCKSLILNDGRYGFYQLHAYQIAIGKGVKTALDSDDLFAYDSSTGKLYTDFNGPGGVAGKEFVTFSNKPKFTAEQLANEVITIVGDKDEIGYFYSWMYT